MFKKIPLSKLHKRLWSHDKIIMVLVCILIALFYLQGEHFVHCRHIHPDKIMDLQCSFSPCLSKDEQTIYSESKGNIQFVVSSVEMLMSSVYNPFKIKSGLFPEYFHLRDPNKILHILQRYKS